MRPTPQMRNVLQGRPWGVGDAGRRGRAPLGIRRPAVSSTRSADRAGRHRTKPPTRKRLVIWSGPTPARTAARPAKLAAAGFQNTAIITATPAQPERFSRCGVRLHTRPGRQPLATWISLLP